PPGARPAQHARSLRDRLLDRGTGSADRGQPRVPRRALPERRVRRTSGRGLLAASGSCNGGAAARVVGAAMSAIADFVLAHDDLGHLFEGAVLMLLAAIPLGLIAIRRRVTGAELAIPAVVVTAWFFSREKAQFELALKEELGL